MPELRTKKLVVEPRYCSVAQAADYMQCNAWLIRRMIERGDLTGYKYGQRVMRVSLAELDALLAAGATK